RGGESANRRTFPARVGGGFKTVSSRTSVANPPPGRVRASGAVRKVSLGRFCRGRVSQSHLWVAGDRGGLPGCRAAGAVWSGLPPAPEHGLTFFFVDAGLKRCDQGLDGERFEPFDHGDSRLSRLGGFAEFGPHVVAEDVGEFTGDRPAVLLDDATR